MKGCKLLASSPTLEGIRDAIVRFYAGSTVTLAPWPSDPHAWTVSTGRGLCASVIVQEVRGRYRFQRLPEGHTIAQA